MKVLVLTSSLPTPSWGAGTRNYYFLKALATRYTVSLLSLVEREEDVEKATLLNDFVHTIKCVTRPANSKKRKEQLTYLAQGKSYSIASNSFPAVQEALDQLCAEDHYEMVLFESALMANYRVPQGMKCIIDEHNVEYELLWRTFKREAVVGWRKWYNWWESSLLKPVEIALCKKADLVLATSERDGSTLREKLPSAVVDVVPNGVDIEVFQSDTLDQPSHQIIFTGAMNYYPNIDAVLTFAKNSWPLIKAQIPDATWLIVGREPPSQVKALESLAGVTVTGSVADVRPYMATSAVAIAPLQIGGGTRLKILEAFAMSRPVVSTSIGCEGLSVTHEKNLLIADHPEEFAQAVIRLLQNPQMRTQLGSAGRLLVEQEYSWESCGARLLHILEEHMSEREKVC